MQSCNPAGSDLRFACCATDRLYGSLTTQAMRRPNPR
jgi:hypothetical protein